MALNVSMKASTICRRHYLNPSQIPSCPSPTWSYHPALSMWGLDVECAKGCKAKDKEGGE